MMNSRAFRNIVLGLALATVVAGCTRNPVTETEDCGAGDEVTLPSGRAACVYRWAIVIETGFDSGPDGEGLASNGGFACPSFRPNRFDFPEQFVVCGAFPSLLPLEIGFLKDAYGPSGTPWAFSGGQVQPTDAVDILWVIDNSGSMCQEQQHLRENFRNFALELAERGLDFRVAVTTTQMNEDYPLEPVAQPGRLQSAPQPVPGFDTSCHRTLDEMGQPAAGFAPIREALTAAVSCMVTPDQSLLAWSDGEIECALYGGGCEIAGLCGGGMEPCQPEHLFPPPQSYRSIPKVLDAADYRLPTGDLDVTALEADFACISHVGTRGYGIEKGLGAAVQAVSPALVTGDNSGFLRPDARFALMFVTDENDCTHDGTLAEASVCGGDVCEFANADRPELVDGPLTPVRELKRELMENLAAAKGRELSDAEVFVASIHGRSMRYAGAQLSEDECSQASYEGIQPVCATKLGVAYSGDRYERFLLQFPPGNFFPEPDTATGLMEGWMCRGDFSPAVGRLGTWLGDAVQ